MKGDDGAESIIISDKRIITFEEIRDTFEEGIIISDNGIITFEEIYITRDKAIFISDEINSFT